MDNLARGGHAGLTAVIPPIDRIAGFLHADEILSTRIGVTDSGPCYLIRE
jgi:hypothetical protein